MDKSKLVNGLIPAFTDCPFRKQCEIAAGGRCFHKGDKHPVPFSCASARGFDIVQQYKGKQK